MNPFLAIGQIIVSIALMAAILLQARGTGLSGTFGGDSAVYRSRRGIERRLFQFTIALARPLRRSSRSSPTPSRRPRRRPADEPRPDRSAVGRPHPERID